MLQPDSIQFSQACIFLDFNVFFLCLAFEVFLKSAKCKREPLSILIIKLIQYLFQIIFQKLISKIQGRMKNLKVERQGSNIFNKNNLSLHKSIFNFSEMNSQRQKKEEDCQSLFIWGQFPDEYAYSSYRYIPFPHAKIRKVACGFDYFVFLTERGEVYEVRKHEMESESEEVMKIQFENKKRIEGIACGKSHSIAWNKQEIFGWGQNNYGALGHENEQKTLKPRKIPFLIPFGQQIEDIQCGNNTTIIKISEDYYGFGDNRKGQLGFVLKSYTLQPEIIKVYNRRGGLLKNIKSIKIGHNFIIALDDDDNFYGSGELQLLGLRYNTSDGLQFIEKISCSEKVTDYVCKSELYVLYEDKLVIYGNFMGRIYREIKLKEKGAYQMKVGKQFGFLINSNQVYSWGYSQQKNFRTSKQPLGQIQINHNFQESLVDCYESYGVTVMNQKECSHFVNFYESNFETQKFKRQLKEREKQKEEILGRKYNNKAQKDKDSYENRISNLERENKEQKQIIGLFEQYVKKLQVQNKNLKNIVSSIDRPPAQIEENHEIGQKIKDLRLLLSNIIKQHNNYI